MRIALALLITLILAGASQPVPLTGTSETNSPQAPAAQERQEVESAPSGTVSAPLVVKLMDAPDQAAKTAEDKKQRDEHTAFEHWANGWIIGLTAGLVLVGIIQGIVLFYTAFVSNKAANAAILAAQAAIGVELPALVLHILKFKNDNVITDTAIKWWVLLHAPELEIEVKNYGRTPAFVTSQAIEIKFGELPDIPDYSRTAYDLDTGTVIENQATYPLGTAVSDRYYSQEEVDDLCHGRNTLWTFGYIQYRDFLNQRHVLRFCREMIPLDSETGSHRWIDSGPEKYSESF